VALSLKRNGKDRGKGNKSEKELKQIARRCTIGDQQRVEKKIAKKKGEA